VFWCIYVDDLEGKLERCLNSLRYARLVGCLGVGQRTKAFEDIWDSSPHPFSFHYLLSIILQNPQI